MNFNYLVITRSLPGKFAHLYDFSIRSFYCRVCRSFHTLSRYDFRSNVFRVNSYLQWLVCTKFDESLHLMLYDNLVSLVDAPRSSNIFHCGPEDTIKWNKQRNWIFVLTFSYRINYVGMRLNIRLLICMYWNCKLCKVTLLIVKQQCQYYKQYFDFFGCWAHECAVPA